MATENVTPTRPALAGASSRGRCQSARRLVLPMRSAASMDPELTKIDKVAFALEQAASLADLAACVVDNGLVEELSDGTLGSTLRSIELYVRDAAAANHEKTVRS